MRLAKKFFPEWFQLYMLFYNNLLIQHISISIFVDFNSLKINGNYFFSGIKHVALLL